MHPTSIQPCISACEDGREDEHAESVARLAHARANFDELPRVPGSALRLVLCILFLAALSFDVLYSLLRSLVASMAHRTHAVPHLNHSSRKSVSTGTHQMTHTSQTQEAHRQFLHPSILSISTTHSSIINIHTIRPRSAGRIPAASCRLLHFLGCPASPG